MPMSCPAPAMPVFAAGTRVRHTVTGEIGTVMHGNAADEWSGAGREINVRFDTPARGCSPQRDEWATVFVPVADQP
jgi:hypothetical protein